MPNSTTLFFRPFVAVVLLVVAVLALPSVAVSQERPIKIAVVNLDFVAAQSKAGKQLKSDLDALQEAANAEIQARGQTSAALRQQVSDGINSLSENKLTELQKAYEDSQIDLKRYQDDKQREGQKLQEEGLRRIEAEMEPVFKAIRDEEGFDLILNYVPGVVVMAGERVDITQKVIERLNAAGN